MRPLKIIAIAIAAAVLGFTAARWFATENGVGGSSGTDSDEKEILYWVAPMDPNYRRDEPGKSPMGMDLVPVYADGTQGGDGGEAPGLEIDPAVINNIGVRTAPVERTTLSRRIETVGFITPDANRVGHIHVRADGWIENLIADNEGERVAAGDVVFEIYSPALVSAQDEYLQALRTGSDELVDAGRRRLRSLGMAESQIDTVRETRETRQRFEVRSPQDGYIMELNVRDGMFVEPGTTIMSLADLSEVWVDVDVFEQQIGWVAPGQAAEMRLPFAPDRVWRGEVEYVYPTIRPETRTARVRLAFDNPDLALKPNMYAEVDIAVSPRRDVLAVPGQAVIRTGNQERVILAQGGGRFRPAEVRTGIESGGRVEIVEGLRAGERVVVSAQFLIDSEASMDASLLRMIGDESGGMDHSGHDMEGMDHSGHDMGEMDHSGHDMEGMDHSGHDMEGPDHSLPPPPAGESRGGGRNNGDASTDSDEDAP
jgi:Cu(I)/Ag(I) efflux system membrane fusion protein